MAFEQIRESGDKCQTDGAMGMITNYFRDIFTGVLHPAHPSTHVVLVVERGDCESAEDWCD